MPVSRRTRARTKPILVGESNPYGSDPYYALYPWPEGCSGHRLCVRILGMTRGVYLRTFERVNLCNGPWDDREAAERARELLSDGANRRFVLLGTKVCAAFGTPYKPYNIFGIRAVLPHPSGRCRLWTEAGAYDRARKVLAIHLPEIAHLLGEVANAEIGADE